MSSRKLALSHLFRALDAELALQRSFSVYLGKAKHEDAFAIMRYAAHSNAPTSDTCLGLLLVFNERHIHSKQVLPIVSCHFKRSMIHNYFIISDGKKSGCLKYHQTSFNPNVNSGCCIETIFNFVNIIRVLFGCFALG